VTSSDGGRDSFLTRIHIITDSFETSSGNESTPSISGAKLGTLLLTPDEPQVDVSTQKSNRDEKGPLVDKAKDMLVKYPDQGKESEDDGE
jgi:hypothetical protein